MLTSSVLQEDIELGYQTFDFNIPKKKPWYANICEKAYSYLPSSLSEITWQKALTITTAVATSSLLIPYTYATVTTIPLKNLTYAIWQALPFPYKLGAVSITSIMFGLSIIVRYHFFPEIVQKIKNIFSNYCATWPDFIFNNIILFLSLGTAIAAAAIGYDSYAWVSLTVGVFAAGASFFTESGFRLVFMVRLLKEKIKQLFNANWKAQQSLIDIVECYNDLYPADNDDDNYMPINQETVIAWLDKKADEIEKFIIDQSVDVESAKPTESIESFIESKSVTDKTDAQAKSIFQSIVDSINIKSCFDIAIRSSLALYFGGSFYVFYSLNGFYGIELACKKINEKCDLHSLPITLQLIIANIAGDSSAMLAGLVGAELPDLLKNTCKHVMAHPIDGLKIFPILVGSVACSIGIIGALNARLISPNVYHLTTANNIVIPIVLIGAVTVSTFLNFGAGLQVVIINNQPAAKQKIHYARNNKFEKSAQEGLKLNSLFKPGVTKEKLLTLIQKNKDNLKLSTINPRKMETR